MPEPEDPDLVLTRHRDSEVRQSSTGTNPKSHGSESVANSDAVKDPKNH